ncbi:MAG: P-loop NTPase [Desulfotignum sp.]|nr:P-loop NTPase [Desulfotignum sp.]
MKPVIWRDPVERSAIRQFRNVDWGDLDYLIIDSPPGTGNEPLDGCTANTRMPKP